MSSGDYERMTECEILKALADERLDIGSREEEGLITNWIAKNPKNNERMMKLKADGLRRRGTDCRLGPVVRDRIPREIILAIGGWSTGGPSDIVEVFNPRAHTWVVPDPIVREIPRAYHGAVLCNEKMIIFGGFNGREYFQHAKLFDLNKKNWEYVTNMHDRRCYVAATPFADPTGNHHVVAVGGYNGFRRLNSGEILNIEKNHWYHLPFMAKQRSDAGAVVLAGRPTVIGGFDGRLIHNDIEMLDFESQSCLPQLKGLGMVHQHDLKRKKGGFLQVEVVLLRLTRYTSFLRRLPAGKSASTLDWQSPLKTLTGSSVMRSVRTGVSAVTYDTNAVIVVGGFNGVRRLKSTEFYDHRVGLWYPLPDMEITRSNFGIEIMNGCIYIAGGFDGSRTTNTVERFDMRAYKWETLPSMSIPKSALRLIRIADHDAIKGLINFKPQTVDFI
ncbi:hypothetical protein Y032_0045g1223 [Ancylostoma ceylanicum]|uniref:Kelch repeat protein n=2 Tax=Ancylostoma ceylanicum TaxID=53326 RepID=A0A016UD33_9BILA|nr:hypothetical protein Y032_0045g1223 [Ancylostoma ceylanicum]